MVTRNQVRKLFITHNIGMVGGANKSLRGLIRNLDEKVDLIAPIDHTVSNQQLKEFFGENINKVYRFYLPSRSSIEGYDNTLSNWCYTEMRYLQDKNKIYELIEKNKYDFVHLNSYILYPLLNRKYPMYIHVREIYNGNVASRLFVNRYFQRAKGVIYIDYAVKEALAIRCKKSMILNNPFNQRAVLDVELERTYKKYNISGETVFAFVTDQKVPVKGLDFIADGFIKSNCNNAKLLIVGMTAVAKYNSHKNISFVGKTNHMEEIYAITDYVLRGEPFFAIGRTVYEGLFSGCNVIVPGDKSKNLEKMFCYKKFKKQINMYSPRNTKEFVDIIKQKSQIKKEKRMGLSNEQQYIKKFKGFINGEGK